MIAEAVTLIQELPAGVRLRRILQCKDTKYNTFDAMKQLLKTIYHLIPFKQDLFSVIRAFNPPEKMYQHLHFKGVFNVKTGNMGNFFKIKHYGYQIENELFWKGIKGYEPVSTKLWLELSKSARTIIDVGANTGVFTLMAASVNKRATIYAFEPVKRVYKKLTDNLALNDFKAVAFPIALSNQSGEIDLYDNEGEEHNYTASLNPKHRPEYKGSPVKTMTLDEFCEENAIVVDLIKIDVERHEPEVIEGFQKHIRKHRPTILIELLDEDLAVRVGNLLTGIDYKYFSISEESGLREEKQLHKSDSFNFLICTEEVAKRVK